MADQTLIPLSHIEMLGGRQEGDPLPAHPDCEARICPASVHGLNVCDHPTDCEDLLILPESGPLVLRVLSRYVAPDRELLSMEVPDFWHDGAGWLLGNAQYHGWEFGEIENREEALGAIVKAEAEKIGG